MNEFTLKPGKCIFIHRDGANDAIKYTIQSDDGEVRNISPEQLRAILNLYPDYARNLELEDETIIEKYKNLYNNVDLTSYDNMIAKARMLGICKEIKAFEGGKFTVIEDSEILRIFIPDNVIRLVNDLGWIQSHIMNVKGVIKLIGGSNLINIDNLFGYCNCAIIDLTEFDTRNLVSMNGTFKQCTASLIIINKFKTDNVRMVNTFAGCTSKLMEHEEHIKWEKKRGASKEIADVFK